MHEKIRKVAKGVKKTEKALKTLEKADVKRDRACDAAMMKRKKGL